MYLAAPTNTESTDIVESPGGTSTWQLCTKGPSRSAAFPPTSKKFRTDFAKEKERPDAGSNLSPSLRARVVTRVCVPLIMLTLSPPLVDFTRDQADDLRRQGVRQRENVELRPPRWCSVVLLNLCGAQRLHRGSRDRVPLALLGAHTLAVLSSFERSIWIRSAYNASRKIFSKCFMACGFDVIDEHRSLDV